MRRREAVAALAAWAVLLPLPGGAAQPGGPAADPYEAYEAGLYGEALRGFLDRQVARPDDPEVLLNVGNAHYKLEDWAAAEDAFAAAAGAASPQVRQQALYSLGNTAYRQGRLEEAVERYQAALELAPNDEDSKFNLEFVRREIERRRQQAQQQQQQQQQQQGEQPEGEQPPQGGGEGSQDPDAERREGQGEGERGGEDEGEGDGVPDGRDPQPHPGAAEAAARPGELSPEEAERYLQALAEVRPALPHPPPGNRQARPEKDW